MSQRSVERLREWAVFFHENKDRGRDYDKERAFLHLVIDGLLELNSHLLEDVQLLEGKPRESVGHALLWTPNGYTSKSNGG